MSAPIRFYFDFASAYAYCAASQIDGIAERYGRRVEWRPILLWAVLKARDIPAPVVSSARWTYLLRDMERSAAFFELPYRQPVKLPLSSHAAARLFYATAAAGSEQASVLSRRLFHAFFAEHRDISDKSVIATLAVEAGLSRADAMAAIDGDIGRAALEQANAAAIDDGVIGSPHIVADGESFFGADRLDQLRWYLAGGWRRTPEANP